VEEELLLMLLEQEKMKMVEKEKLFWDTAGLRRKGCCPGLLLMMTLKAVGKSSKNALGWK
jgi:hypothetical protein